MKRPTAAFPNGAHQPMRWIPEKDTGHKMINATLRLTRIADDGAEMFRKYYLVADFSDVRGQGKASIIPLSAGAPMPDGEHLIVKGGENEAMMAAADLIKGLPGNTGFLAAIDFDPE